MPSNWLPSGHTSEQPEGGIFQNTSPIHVHPACGFAYIGSDPPEECPLCEVVQMSIQAQEATNLALQEQLTLAKILRRKHDGLEKRVDALVLRVHGVEQRLRVIEPV